ncbi:uncharacterized protein PV06_03127 [Exophiala oligosperma]|uniref:Uncharacterized protein n=1 Tax=Exophiala oligosperma TaxID=215243 RepID=A0A0D2C4F9_9EURO|nr:uncharacterized protein PV06_03127 [Exophiala oligosperma]KIW44672.1 hypothetical protein PV06_03127 [Exophiala oligosperma]
MAIQSRSGESAINSATLMGRLRGSAKKKTTAIRMKLSGCMHARDGSETGEQPSSIHEFLSSSPPARRHKHEETNAHGSSTHAWSQIRPHLQLELRSNHSQANISELSARPSGQFSISTVSLPSSVAAPGWENPPPDLTSKGKETLEEMVRNSLCRIYGSKHVAELPAADESVTSPQSSRYQPYSRPGSNKPNPHATDKQGREQYSWPLVDFEEEMFLNADPSRAGRPDDRRGLPKYQEPRIPDLDFASGRLEDEVAAVLGKLVVGERASTRSPMSRMGREHVHEMEAASPITNYVSPQTNSRGDCPPAQRVELEGTRYVTNISPERRRERQHQRQHQRQQTMSPVSPLSSEGGRVAYHDYNWPRFSEVQRYEDPAGEHSRRYRDRRREMRRDRAEERYR